MKELFKLISQAVSILLSTILLFIAIYDYQIKDEQPSNIMILFILYLTIISKQND